MGGPDSISEYCRKVSWCGDAIERISVHPVGMSVRRMSNLLYFEKDDLDGAKDALRIHALSPGWKQSFETRLAKAKLSQPVQQNLER